MTNISTYSPTETVTVSFDTAKAVVDSITLSFTVDLSKAISLPTT